MMRKIKVMEMDTGHKPKRGATIFRVVMKEELIKELEDLLEWAGKTEDKLDKKDKLYLFGSYICVKVQNRINELKQRGEL